MQNNVTINKPVQNEPELLHLDVTSDCWTAATKRLWNHFNINQLALFRLPLTIKFRSVTQRTGLLLHGDYGWSECAPFAEYQAQEAATWFSGALLDASTPTPKIQRQAVPVNVTIPVQDPDAAAQRAKTSGCKTAKVKVADPRCSAADDVERVEAVADALYALYGSAAKVRIDVNGAWDAQQAIDLIPIFDRACSQIGGLEYVEQPCMDVADLALVRRNSTVRIAADESIRRSSDPGLVRQLEAADLVVVKVSPLGGITRALALLEELQMPAVVSSAVDSSIGLAVGVQLAAALPSLPFACGLDTRRLLGADVVAKQMVSEKGELSVSLANQVRNETLLSGVSLDPKTAETWVDRVNLMVPFVCSSVDQH